MVLIKKQTKSQKENKVKKINHNNTITELSNSTTWLDYMCEESTRLFPEKDAWRKRFCYTLHLWSLRSDSLEVQQFCDEYKISYQTLRGMVDRYPDIAMHYAEAKRRIAARRRIGALKNEFNVTAAFKDMHRYDDEWIPLMKQAEDIKKENVHAGDKIVIIEKFPEEDKE